MTLRSAAFSGFDQSFPGNLEMVEIPCFWIENDLQLPAILVIPDLLGDILWVVRWGWIWLRAWHWVPLVELG